MLVVRALVDAVTRAGFPGDEFSRAAGIDATQLDSADLRVPRTEVYRISELALELTGDPAFGLHWAERLTSSTFVPVSHLIAHAPSLRQGLESLSQFERLLTDEPAYELIASADKVTVRCLHSTGESPRMQRLLAEMVVAGFFRILRAFSLQAGPEYVSFAYPAPPYHSEYTRIFEHTERFEQPFSGIVFDRALLNVVSPHKDEDVHEALRMLAERRMSRLGQRVPYALRVRELLIQRGWPERIDMQTVAASLGLSVRSLRRRLAAEGKSYNEVENDALAMVAKHLLREKQRSIQETAYEMGFSDTTTFHRAFKRWTGTTPNAYRDAPK